MVEWPEEKDSISCTVLTGDSAGISNLKAAWYALAHCGSLFSLLEMQRNGIDEVNDVAFFR